MLAIYGPTVTGKTSLALKIAKKFNAAIVSADSRQIYKNLDLGTGKISFDSVAKKDDNYWVVDGISIYGFDVRKPEQEYSVADFIKDANNFFKTIKIQGKTPIVVGGTGYYIKSLIDPPLGLGIPRDEELRTSLEKLSIEKLYKKLMLINPSRASGMNTSDKKNPRRLIRAIEVSSYDSVHRKIKSTNLELIGLTASNKYLFNKADLWLETRLKKGLIDEVDSLLKQGVNPNWLISLGLEYKWLTRSLIGNLSREEAMLRLKGDIHSLIRRQKTFFRQFKNIKIFNIEEKNWQTKLDKMIDLWYTQKKQ